MKARAVFILLAISVMAVTAASAQDAPVISFATYYNCPQAKAERADAIYRDVVAPLMKAEVAAGRITAYGWGKHWEGGEWRRLEYMTGTDLDKLVDARESVIKKLTAGDLAKSMDEFLTICPSHDDYIWASVTGSQTAGDAARVRAPVAMSTYFVCEPESEGEADAIIKAAFAPLLNQQVKEGKISAWSWLQHRTGGKYRRALVIDGPDHKSLLKLWGVLSPALQKANPDLSRRFDGICRSHSDYIWDIVAN